MLRRLFSCCLVLIALPAGAQAQSAADTAAALARLHGVILRYGEDLGPEVWPGFRPDTIPTLYVVPGLAKLLLPWQGTLPAGFEPLPGVPDAGWTDTQSVSLPPGRIAFLSVGRNASAADILGLALHEGFHRFERSVEQKGTRFGGGENSMLTAYYPVFDTANEALVALEGRLLLRAVRASRREEARRLARSFLAIRAEQRAGLDTSMVEYEDMSEMNEGLAQYALLRGLVALGQKAGDGWPSAAHDEIARETGLLDSLLRLGPRSVRRRFYATGSAVALWLDAWGPADWKAQLVRDNLTLTQAMAHALAGSGTVGLAADSLAVLRRQAEKDAAVAVGAARARRLAQVDSLRSRSGMRLTLDPAAQPGHQFQWCGFDPQNLLQAPGGELLHMRFLRVCNGQAFWAQFEDPVLQDGFGGAIHAVLSDTTGIALTANGAALPLPAEGATLELTGVRIEGPAFSLQAPRATLTREDGVLLVTPGM